MGQAEEPRLPSPQREAVRQAVGGGCQIGWGRLLSVINPMEAGTWGQEDSGWAQAGRPGGGRFVHPSLPSPLTPSPPPPPSSVGPNFSHHKARVQVVGWFPLGTRKQGSKPFAAPTPTPNRNGARPKAGPAHPPPPNMPSHPHCRPTHGDRGPSPRGKGADAERQVCWDLGPTWYPAGGPLPNK